MLSDDGEYEVPYDNMGGVSLFNITVNFAAALASNVPSQMHAHTQMPMSNDLYIEAGGEPEGHGA